MISAPSAMPSSGATKMNAAVFKIPAHTSGAVQYLQAQQGYSGSSRYVETDAVTDGDLITAGPTEPVAFAREIFRRLAVNRPEVIDAWYRLFGRSDASAYEVLMSA